jgi:predicted dinucleotide-binding enzyme
MKVAIIGSGNAGKAIAASATRAGHDVTMSARSHENAKEAARATNSKAAASNKEAVKDSDLVVLAVPADKVDEVVDSLSNDLDGKVIIDVTNRVNPQDPGQVLDGSSTAERIQRRVPKAQS